MRHYTKVPNEILESNQISIQGRCLYIVLLKHCGKKDRCWPSQSTIGKALGCSSRQVRNLILELKNAGLIEVKREGWNRANTYFVSKDLDIDRKGNSPVIGSLVPLHSGNTVPTKSTYLIERDKTSNKGFEELREKVRNLALSKTF